MMAKDHDSQRPGEDDGQGDNRQARMMGKVTTARQGRRARRRQAGEVDGQDDDGHVKMMMATGEITTAT